jgi:predicted nucleic acid-binding Zn ribbon protein
MSDLEEQVPVSAAGGVPANEQITPAVALYERLRKKASASWKRRPRIRTEEKHLEGAAAPFGPGRDPSALGDVLGNLTEDLGWTPFLMESDIVGAWPEIVGAEVAARTTPVGVQDGILTVSCESTAWATQLRIMSSQILTKLLETFPESRISQVIFRGPNAPSWKRGQRSVPGRGPRDTYG